MDINDLIAQSNPQIPTQQGDTLDEIQQQRQLRRLALMRALSQPTVSYPGQPPAVAWQPMIQQVTGAIADRKLAGKEQDARQQYNQQLANVLAAAKGTPDQTIEKPIPGPVRPGIDKPLGNTTETIPGKPGSFQDVVQAMIGSGNPQLQQTGLQGMLSGMSQNEATDRMMKNEAFKALLQGQIKDPALQETIRHNRATELAQNPFLGMQGGQMPSGGSPGTPGKQISGDDFLKTINPNIAAQVKALAEGRMQFPAGFALKSPYWQQMISMVSQYDPSFDAVNYNARAKTRADFTSGKSAQSINALNTVLGHLSTLSDAADALDNSSTPAYNTVANWMAKQTGDPRIDKFNATKKAVVDELTRAYRGSGGSEADIKTWSDSINAAGSPAQLHQTIGQIGELLNSKVNALGEQYNQGMGTTENPIRLITPHAQQTLDLLRSRAGNKQDSSQNSIDPVEAEMRRRGLLK